MFGANTQQKMLYIVPSEINKSGAESHIRIAERAEQNGCLMSYNKIHYLFVYYFHVHSFQEYSNKERKQKLLFVEF